MMDVVHREAATSYRFATNSLAMVDAEPRIVEPRSSRCRILLIGDSFTEGYGVGWESSYVGILAEWWKRYDIDLLNAGVIGYSPSIYYRKVRHLIEDVGLKFDALFVAIDMSDIKDEWANYDMDGEERVVHITRDFPAEPVRNPTVADRMIFAVIDNSLTAHLVFEIISRSPLKPDFHAYGSAEAPPIDLRQDRPRAPLRSTTSDLTGLLKTLSVDGSSIDRLPMPFVAKYGYWALDHADWLEYGKNGLRVAAERMDRLVALLRRHKIPLSISVHPWQTNLLAGDKESVQVKFWRAWALKRDVGFINLFPAFFREGSEAANADFLKGDFHWNSRGHAIVAEEISRQYDPRSHCRAR
jgi:hypothetical protein